MDTDNKEGRTGTRLGSTKQISGGTAAAATWETACISMSEALPAVFSDVMCIFEVLPFK